MEDVTNVSENWDNNFFFENLPNNIANKIIAIHTIIEADGLNTIGLGGTITRQFSIKMLTIYLF